jgi:hypothetical protein
MWQKDKNGEKNFIFGGCVFLEIVLPVNSSLFAFDDSSFSETVENINLQITDCKFESIGHTV